MTTGLGQVGGSANIKIVSALPTTPQSYYGDSVHHTAWTGGEMVYHSGDSRVYIQTSTSGSTAVWVRLLEQLATSTTSTSTSSTSTTSTSSSSTTTGA